MTLRTAVTCRHWNLTSTACPCADTLQTPTSGLSASLTMANESRPLATGQWSRQEDWELDESILTLPFADWQREREREPGVTCDGKTEPALATHTKVFLRLLILDRSLGLGWSIMPLETERGWRDRWGGWGGGDKQRKRERRRGGNRETDKEWVRKRLGERQRDTGRQTDRQTGRDNEKDRQRGGKRERQRQTGRQTEIETDGLKRVHKLIWPIIRQSAQSQIKPKHYVNICRHFHR